MSMWLTHWGQVTHICVSKLTFIGSDKGLSPERRQAIIWTNAGILSIGPLGTNFSEFLIEIQTFSLKKIRLKMSSAKYCSFRLGLNVLTCVPFCVYLQFRIQSRHRRSHFHRRSCPALFLKGWWLTPRLLNPRWLIPRWLTPRWLIPRWGPCLQYSRGTEPWTAQT